MELRGLVASWVGSFRSCWCQTGVVTDVPGEPGTVRSLKCEEMGMCGVLVAFFAIFSTALAAICSVGN